MPSRRHDWENHRRALAMANPESWALKREEAMALLAELQELEGQLRELRALRDGIVRLLDATAPIEGRRS